MGVASRSALSWQLLATYLILSQRSFLHFVGLSSRTRIELIEGRGEFVVVLDSADRENEGDLVAAAEDMSTEKMAFMIRFSSGLVCAPLLPDRAADLQLPQMVPDNEDPNRTAYTVSVDARDPAITTGISAHDRAFTCRMLASVEANPVSFRRPGHLFPLQARPGGVRERPGHTEAAIELCRWAGKQPVAVISELVEDGKEVVDERGLSQARRSQSDMMRRDGCLAFGRRWGLKVCTIEHLVSFVETG